jgi:hypothetical protein
MASAHGLYGDGSPEPEYAAIRTKLQVDGRLASPSPSPEPRERPCRSLANALSAARSPHENILVAAADYRRRGLAV